MAFANDVTAFYCMPLTTAPICIALHTDAPQKCIKSTELIVQNLLVTEVMGAGCWFFFSFSDFFLLLVRFVLS